MNILSLRYVIRYYRESADRFTIISQSLTANAPDVPELQRQNGNKLLIQTFALSICERRSIPFSQVLRVIFPMRLAGCHFPRNRLVLNKRALVSSPDNQYSVSLDDCLVSYGSACCGPDASCIAS